MEKQFFLTLLRISRIPNTTLYNIVNYFIFIYVPGWSYTYNGDTCRWNVRARVCVCRIGTLVINDRHRTLVKDNIAYIQYITCPRRTNTWEKKKSFLESLARSARTRGARKLQYYPAAGSFVFLIVFFSSWNFSRIRHNWTLHTHTLADGRAHNAEVHELTSLQTLCVQRGFCRKIASFYAHNDDN